MKRLERRLGQNTISDGNAGLGTTFTAIANNMVRSGGRIALVLPTSAMMGGSYDDDDDQPYSWQRLRNLLYDHYDQLVVVSIAQSGKKDSAFSADSDFADCMVIARRIQTGRHSRPNGPLRQSRRLSSIKVRSARDRPCHQEGNRQYPRDRYLGTVWKSEARKSVSSATRAYLKIESGPPSALQTRHWWNGPRS